MMNVMKDRRKVDDVSTEELERILLLKKREARLQRFRGKPAAPAAPAATPAPIQQPRDLTPETPQFVDALALVEAEEEQLPAEMPAIAEPKYRPLEEIEEDYPAEQARPPRQTLRRISLLVEVAAVLGLIALVIVGVQGLLSIDDTISETSNLSATSEAELISQRNQPTATPLAEIGEVVLPGGHIWDANGNHQFNMAEVPLPYQQAFQDELDAPRPVSIERSGAEPGRIQIPRIEVNASVVRGDNWNALRAGVGHHDGSANPGEMGNLILSAHNDIFGEIFRDLDDLKPGDEVRVQNLAGEWFSYRVTEGMVVEPSAVWVLNQNAPDQTRPRLTLISGYPYQENTARIVIIAELAE